MLQTLSSFFVLFGAAGSRVCHSISTQTPKQSDTDFLPLFQVLLNALLVLPLQMGNCLCDLFFANSNDSDPRILYHTCSIHPSTNSSSHGAWSTRNILGCDHTDISSIYDLGEELGRGQFGVIRLCTHKSDDLSFACKSIAKSKLTCRGDVRDVQREIQIMKQLSGHPNIVELRDVFEDEDSVHLVMELCKGGELFDRIVEKKMYSEPEAALACKTLVEVIQFCHANGVIHRDLKPENILLASKSHPSDLKVADFGLAVHFQPGEPHSGMAGSAYYIAPEVLRGEYGQEIDVWSAGVVLYVLLSGVPPFWDETEEGIFDAIRYGHLDLTSDPWPQRSAEVKELLRRILCQDSKQRLTPDQILNHKWIIENTAAAAEEAQPPPQSPALNVKLSLNLPRGSNSANMGSWKSWKSAASLSSSSSSDSDTGFLEGLISASRDESFKGFLLYSERDCDTAASSAVEEEEDEGSTESHAKFYKWTSFAQVTEPTFSEFLSMVISSLDDSGLPSPRINTQFELCKAGCSCTVLAASKSRRTLVVNSPKGRFLVVHDRENMRIGWKPQGSSSMIEAASWSLPQSDNLLLSSYPPLSQTQ